MYIVISFCVLLVAVMLAWFGKHDKAVIVFAISMLLAVSSFYHHMTDVIGLSL